MIQSRLEHIKKHHPKIKISRDLPPESEVNRLIDHTILASDATVQQIEKLCEEAIQHKFASVCVNGCYVAKCASLLKGTGVRTCTVVGFPLGQMTTRAKVFETEDAIENGADEVDMVLNQAWMKDGLYDEVYAEVCAIAAVCKQHKILLKVIIEAACLADDALITDACLLCQAAGADFVKTSTGMHKAGGACVEHVRIMRAAVGAGTGVKAAGGVRTLDDCRAMVAAGANRIGTSGGVAIVQGLVHQNGY